MPTRLDPPGFFDNNCGPCLKAIRRTCAQAFTNAHIDMFRNKRSTCESTKSVAFQANAQIHTNKAKEEKICAKRKEIEEKRNLFAFIDSRSHSEVSKEDL